MEFSDHMKLEEALADKNLKDLEIEVRFNFSGLQ